MKNQNSSSGVSLISVVIVSKDAAHNLEICLKHISTQVDVCDVEILVVDGGSKDDSKLVAETYGARFINGGFEENQEARRYIGSQLANGDVIAFIDTDNFLTSNTWFKEMLLPFTNPDVMCSFTKWYGVSKSMSPLDQYYGLVGGNDPICYYLGKNDRVEYLTSGLPSGASLVSEWPSYNLVNFNRKKLPTIGANGFLIRKNYLSHLDISDPNEFLHTDIHVNLLAKFPHALYAIVEADIHHVTGETISRSIKKRINYKNKHMVELASYRTYRVFDATSTRDIVRLLWSVLAALTFVEPLMRALIGYVRTRNLYWFYHLVVFPLMVIAYATSTVTSFARKRL